MIDEDNPAWERLVYAIERIVDLLEEIVRQ
jgi:hypothetical protein